MDAIPTAPKPRQLFALLALNHRRVVSAATIVEELWGANPPKSALTTLQTYVLQLRRKLEAASGVDGRQLIVTRNSGYLLTLPANVVFDLDEYTALEADAMSGFRAGADAVAIRTAQRALTLWRGDVLADVPHGRYIDGAVAGLDQSRLALIECRLEAELRLGRHRESLSEFARLVTEHGYNENLHAAYMIALHRSGIRDKALDIYQQFRTRLVDELGVEPSRELQDLHRMLLDSDRQLSEIPAQAWLRGASGPLNNEQYQCPA